MAAPDVIWKNGRFGQTSRRDTWWLSPLLVFLGFGTFIVYATWAAFQNQYYISGPYISPFYSPELWGDSGHALHRAQAILVSELPAVLARAVHPLDPRPVPLHLLLLSRRILQSVLGRSARLRRRRAAQDLLGERTFPLIMQNFHRYFLRLSYIVWGFPGLRRVESLLVRRSLRHRPRHAGAGRQRRAAGRLHVRLPRVPPPDRRHARPASRSTRCATNSTTASAASTARTRSGRGPACSRSAFADIYVRLCSMGIWHDWRIL